MSVVQRIINALPHETSFFRTGTRLSVRFYGGWYAKSGLSKAGQDLAAELRGSFPTSILVGTRRAIVRFRVSADLARSLLLDPMHDLLHTLRRAFPPIHNISSVPFRGCTRPNTCPLAGIEPLVRSGVCPDSSCDTRLSAVFPRGKQQKLVDTMLVADLIYLAAASAGSPTLVVVSSDDDLWPGIRTALHFGASVHHIHTSSRRTSQSYTSAVTARYHEHTIP